jgi:hypothetical protein
MTITPVRRTQFANDYLTPGMVSPILAGMGACILSQNGNKIEVMADNGIRLWVNATVLEPEDVMEKTVEVNGVAMGDLNDPRAVENARVYRLCNEACNHAAFDSLVEAAIAKAETAKAALELAKAELKAAIAIEAKVQSSARKLLRVKALGDAAIVAQLKADYPRFARK